MELRGCRTKTAGRFNPAEPSPQLFEIPSDFKIVAPGGNRDFIIERKISRP